MIIVSNVIDGERAAQGHQMSFMALTYLDLVH
jgi:hypothetical protein